MTKTAILFPGQGAQFPGMGKDFYDCFVAAREVFDTAAAVLGSAFLSVVFEGPEAKLQQTAHTQPAILTVSVAIYRALIDRGVKADAFAGLSLGEYSALVAARAISFEEALPLVQKRGVLMQEAVPEGEGKMTAIMGLTHEKVADLCAEAASIGLVSPANYNCPGQIVISGEKAAVDEAVRLAGVRGAKKITPLKVSAPFHCALLRPVEEKLARELEYVNISPPIAPVVFNHTAELSSDPQRIKDNLVSQVSNPILWEQSMRNLISALEIDRFIGLGPGNSQARLMKRIAPSLKTFSVEKVEDLERLLEEF